MYFENAALAARMAVPLAVAACGTSNQKQGNLVGAIAGGVLGSQIGSGRVAATIAVSLLGGYAGGHIGRKMDEQDRAQAILAPETTPPGRSVPGRTRTPATAIR